METPLLVNNSLLSLPHRIVNMVVRVLAVLLTVIAFVTRPHFMLSGLTPFMELVTDWLGNPRIFFVLSLLLLWLGAQAGAFWHRRRPLKGDQLADFGVVEAATLTLLGLIIGFSFSMAISRYDQRKDYEEAEANAIGTEYVRANLLGAPESHKVRSLLRHYLDLRVRFYETRNVHQLGQINLDTAQLQNEMWSAVESVATAKPTPIVGLAVSGMNDVLNSQGYTQAAWRNRIPSSAWALMLGIAVLGNLLIGYGLRSAETNRGVLVILPLVLSIAFLLIADIDSPRHGFIHVKPLNLIELAQSLPK